MPSFASERKSPFIDLAIAIKTMCVSLWDGKKERFSLFLLSKIERTKNQ